MPTKEGVANSHRRRRVLNQPIKIRPVDSSEIMWVSANSTYLFGRQSGSNPQNARLHRRDKSGTEVQLFDFSDDAWIVGQTNQSKR